MKSCKTPLLIAAVAVMLLSATSAQAYYETWNGWFNAGTLTYNGYDYTYSGSGGEATDSTYTAGVKDTFYSFTPNVGGAAFVCDMLSDTIYLSISTMIGTKETGTSGIKDGSGTWSGSAIRRKNQVENTWNSIYGSWDTNGDTYKFDYNPVTPTYYAEWTVTGGSSGYPTGGGTSSGQRTYYSTDTPP